jgi:hypothetical protein
MNNPKKQISLLTLLLFTFSNLLLAGEPQRGGGDKWDPSKEADRLRNESQMMLQKVEKASPEVKAKMNQVVEVTEKIAVQLEKKSDAMKKRNPKMMEQAHKECEKLWGERTKLMEECKRAFEKMPEKDRQQMKTEGKGEPKKEYEKKEGHHAGAKGEASVAKDEKSKEAEKKDSKDWPSYE